MFKYPLVTKVLILLLVMSLSQIQAASSNKYIEILNTWIGEDADNLLHQWGQPIKVDRISDRYFEVSYQAETAYYHPAIESRSWQECQFNSQGYVIGCNDRYDPGQSAYYTHTQCYTVFEVEDGTIIKWRWEGDCKQ